MFWAEFSFLLENEKKCNFVVKYTCTMVPVQFPLNEVQISLLRLSESLGEEELLELKN